MLERQFSKAVSGYHYEIGERIARLPLSQGHFFEWCLEQLNEENDSVDQVEKKGAKRTASVAYRRVENE